MNTRIAPVLTLALAMSVIGSAQAQTAQTQPATDCSANALHAIVEQGNMMAADQKMSGDVDHDAMAMMAAHSKAASDLAEFEMRCGKTQKAKDAAKQAYDTNREEMAMLQKLLEGGP